MNTDIHVYTFDKLQIWRNGALVEDFISTKAVLLFVYLAMQPGEHSRRKLASMLWSETSDQQALKNLRTVLSSVRQQLGDALIVEHEVLAISPDVLVMVDATQFEAGCVRVFSSAGTLDLLKAMQELAQLYQGDFLNGITVRDAEEFEAWVVDKQRHLQHLYTRLLSEIVEVAHKQSQYDVGLDYAWKLVSLDPLWDAAQRQLMRLLFHTNRANEALLHYEQFAQLLAAELQAVPEAETTALYEQIRARDGAVNLRKPRTVALADMPFVEPVEDIEIAQRMLNTPQCRLLTVFGISGIGKTALVTQLAFHRQHLYRDGAYVVSLKQVQSARDLPYVIANTLGVDFSNQTDSSIFEHILLEYLKNRHLLLVLDNYEDLLPETGFLQRILETAPQVQLIAASQAPLNLFREWLLPLKGLRVPAVDDEHPETYEAVRLFELTAQRTNPRFSLQANAAGVAQICRLVDGLPLAIVIAAGWTQILPINKIIEHIVEGQEFSLPFQQTLPPHHQSLEMMLEYTWNTLSAAEQQALTALSIFTAPFELDEVQQICAVEVGVLTALIQRSLVQKFDEKYRMHQLVWRYARKRLLYSDQREMLGQRYLAYYGRMLEQLRAQPLHEYLVRVETLYSSIWNFDWIAKSFQPVCILSMSRHLMVYWEISRADAVPALLDLLAALEAVELAPEMALLLHLQMGRLWLRCGELAQAKRHLLAAFGAADVDWADLYSLYCVYALLLLQEADGVDVDAAIFGESNLKLTILFLDMKDTASAEGVLGQLLESEPLDRTCIVAAQGAIAADRGDFSAAEACFAEALHGLDESPLRSSLVAALTRTNVNKTSSTP